MSNNKSIGKIKKVARMNKQKIAIVMITEKKAIKIDFIINQLNFNFTE